MQPILAVKRLMVSSLCFLLLSCGATRHATPGPRDARELGRYVLVIERAPEGQLLHSWKPIDAFTAGYPYPAMSRGVQGHIVHMSFSRDCDEELTACEAMCLAGLKGRNWSHMGSGSKKEHCIKKCMQPYLDCSRLKELAEGGALEFHAMDEAIGWIKQNSETLLVGTVVVIAGVAFVVAVGASGGGVLVLAPVIIFSSADESSEGRLLAVQP
ncbi:hypothetical protein [Melittangium boletus]|nr:hypothetical protein [Melittangium boletus]